jgi:acetylornithine/succinyldiaminopimelate/putrescine aminotransferase
MSVFEAFRKHLAPTSSEPIGLVVDRAEGPWVFDPEGRRYLDLLSGIGVANIGHTHPAVVEAVRRQNERHHHVMVYGEYVQEEQALYAAELARVAPRGLDTVFFVSSGAEAVEGALKTARKATGRTGFVAFDGAYHGDTLGALSVSGNRIYQRPFEPLLGPVTVLPYGEAAALAGVDETTAGVIVEPVQGEGGVRIPPDDFLPALAERCRNTGALLILDEVMTGFGRTGRLFASERWGVAPDLLVLAKALGGGYPLGAFVGSRGLMETLTYHPPLAHVTTFGGHPVSCAAGRAALGVLLGERLPTRADEVGERFIHTLREKLLPLGVSEVRGLGLFVGLEFASSGRTRAFVDECREQGILLGWTLHHDHIVRLAPPLITAEDVMEEAAVTMQQVLETIPA